MIVLFNRFSEGVIPRRTVARQPRGVLWVEDEYPKPLMISSSAFFKTPNQTK
jgi:hypothetical protein